MNNEAVDCAFRKLEERRDKEKMLNSGQYKTNYILEKINELNKRINEIAWRDMRESVYGTGVSVEKMKEYYKLISERNKLLQKLYPSMKQSKGNQKTLTKQMNPRKPNY